MGVDVIPFSNSCKVRNGSFDGGAIPTSGFVTLPTSPKTLSLNVFDQLSKPTLHSLKSTASLFFGYPSLPKQMNPIISLSSHFPNRLKFSQLYVTTPFCTIILLKNPSARWYSFLSFLVHCHTGTQWVIVNFFTRNNAHASGRDS